MPLTVVIDYILKLIGFVILLRTFLTYQRSCCWFETDNMLINLFACISERRREA